MKKLLLIFLALAPTLRAATVTGHLGDYFSGDAEINVQFNPRSGFQTVDGRAFLDVPKSVRTTAQRFSLTLLGGVYQMSLNNGVRTIYLTVPADTNTYNFVDLTTNLVVFTYTNTSDWARISSRVRPGDNVTLVTNNAGTVLEWIQINGSAGGGGVTNTDLLTEGATNLFWTTTRAATKQPASANLTNWSALATSAKQDALGFMPQLGSANLTNWSALATSAKQDALGFTPLGPASALNATNLVGVPVFTNLGLANAANTATGHVTFVDSDTDYFSFDTTVAATAFAGDGAALTGLAAANLTGTISNARLAATVTTNNGMLSTALLRGDGGRGVQNATAAGAVPIDADGTATTAAQILALIGQALTNGNTFSFTLYTNATAANGVAVYVTATNLWWTNWGVAGQGGLIAFNGGQTNTGPLIITNAAKANTALTLNGSQNGAAGSVIDYTTNGVSKFSVTTIGNMAVASGITAPYVGPDTQRYMYAPNGTELGFATADTPRMKLGNSALTVFSNLVVNLSQTNLGPIYFSATTVPGIGIDTNYWGYGSTVQYSGPVTNDQRFQVTINTTVTASRSGAVLTNTFSTPYTRAPMVIISPAGQNASSGASKMWYNVGPPVVFSTTTNFGLIWQNANTSYNNNSVVLDFLIIP